MKTQGQTKKTKTGITKLRKQKLKGKQLYGHCT